jgi:phage baseplate assembly protein W
MADQSFLGTGWSFPPSFTGGGANVVTVAGVEDIHQSLQILLSTRLGERVMQDGFGCNLDNVIFEEMDQGLVNTLSSLVSDAILYHEPRISLDRLDVSESGSMQGLLLIRIEYTVRSTNSRFNMVYPFYVNEASVPGAG